MSEEQALERGLKLIPAWQPILWAIVAALFSAGFTWGTTRAQMEQLKADNIRQDLKLESLDRLDRNVIRIGEAIGVGDRLEKAK